MSELVFAGVLCCAAAFFVFPVMIRCSAEKYPDYVVINLVCACWALAGLGIACLIGAPFLGMQERAHEAELAAMAPHAASTADAVDVSVAAEEDAQ